MKKEERTTTEAQRTQRKREKKEIEEGEWGEDDGKGSGLELAPR
jgi:hypothetical protein